MEVGNDIDGGLLALIYLHPSFWLQFLISPFVLVLDLWISPVEGPCLASSLARSFLLTALYPEIPLRLTIFVLANSSSASLHSWIKFLTIWVEVNLLFETIFHLFLCCDLKYGENLRSSLILDLSRLRIELLLSFMNNIGKLSEDSLSIDRLLIFRRILSTLSGHSYMLPLQLELGYPDRLSLQSSLYLYLFDLPLNLTLNCPANVHYFLMYA